MLIESAREDSTGETVVVGDEAATGSGLEVADGVPLGDVAGGLEPCPGVWSRLPGDTFRAAIPWLDLNMGESARAGSASIDFLRTASAIPEVPTPLRPTRPRVAGFFGPATSRAWRSAPCSNGRFGIGSPRRLGHPWLAIIAVSPSATAAVSPSIVKEMDRNLSSIPSPARLGLVISRDSCPRAEGTSTNLDQRMGSVSQGAGSQSFVE